MSCVCAFDEQKALFVDNNPGGRANQLHRQFARVSGVESLKDIAKALKKPGCTYSVHKGFLERNSKVALADSMITLTWSRREEPLEGGTKDTWSKSRSKRKIHLSLYSILQEKRKLEAE